MAAGALRWRGIDKGRRKLWFGSGLGVALAAVLIAGCGGTPTSQASAKSVVPPTGGCGASCAQAGAGGAAHSDSKGASGSAASAADTGSETSNNSVSVVLPQDWAEGSGYSQTNLNLNGPNGINVQLYGDIFKASGYTLTKYFAYRLSQFQHADAGARLCGKTSSIELPGTSTPRDGKSINICYTFTPSEGD